MRIQEHGENPKKMILGREKTPKMSSPCNSTTLRAKPTINSMAISEYNRSKSQFAHSSVRTFTHSKGMIAPRCDSSRGRPLWSMSSLMAVFPESPSPICSGCSSPRDTTTFSPISETSDSQVPTEFSPARNQSSCTVSFHSPTSSKDIDKWMENAKSCCWFRHPCLQNHQFKALDHELSSLNVRSIEAGSVPEELISYLACADSIHGASKARSLNYGRHKLVSGLKPYHAFLDEVKRQELEAEIDAWKKAKYLKLVDKLERKEAAISIWEFEKTKEAMEEMKKLESKLERKRLQALEKTQKKISRAKKKANKKKPKARWSTIEEISAVSAFTEKIRATKSLLLLTLRKFC